jgi:hypothetical protein
VARIFISHSSNHDAFARSVRDPLETELAANQAHRAH